MTPPACPRLKLHHRVDRIAVTAEDPPSPRGYGGTSVQDIFKIAGLDRPNIALLSDAFDLRPRANPAGDTSGSSMSLRSIPEDVRRMEKKNLAVELLERLLQGKIKAQTRTNGVWQNPLFILSPWSSHQPPAARAG